MCIGKKIIYFSILFGLIITLMTALFENTCVIGEFPDVRFVSIPLLGMNYWGMPLPWLKQIVYPGAVKQVIWLHFVVDALFWIAAAFLAKLFFITVAKGEKLAKKPRARRRARRR
jgi:hypothetical protein